MDSSTIPPPTNFTVPFSDQPNNHHHHPPPPNTHPSYADVIHLSPSLSLNFISNHLKRLKDNDLIQMVNKSYILPRSLLPRPSSQASRPKGRPRKVQAQPQAGGGDVVKTNFEPVWAALGLSDEPQAVGLENETKCSVFPMKSVVGSKVGSDGMVSSRRRGCPPAPGGGSGAGSSRGSTRGRGGAVAVQPRSSFGRPVGRPKKPYFTLESPVSAIVAIQDLEEVEAMDVDAPMEDETLLTTAAGTATADLSASLNPVSAALPATTAVPASVATPPNV
ncbi:unnamed protein product [Lupinus luteus]|uniref:H15 domain-containing protein n=1 Tax=Lupinus luteus TaxID=3873 RepID=A0AAV1YEX8_LUPLU